MWPLETKPCCCADHDPVPSDIDCLAPDICHELERLFRRHRRAFVKNKRIMDLAEAKPLARSHRFLNRCPCFFKKKIEIIRLEQRANTRTEQLAYPRARHLLLFKQQVRKMFPLERILNLNRLIRKSLFSLYSRLGNIQPPMEIKPKVKWDKDEWDEHIRILKRLAKPKKVQTPPEMPSKKMSLSEMRRYKKLSKPRKYQIIEKSGWTLSEGLRKYKPSERTIILSKAIVRDTSMLHQELPIEIPLTALKYKASKRTLELAKPTAQKVAQTGPSDFREDPFAVSANALKTKASKRTEELAEPREYENVHIRDDPYAISKAALKAKATPRIIKLAEPKKR